MGEDDNRTAKKLSPGIMDAAIKALTQAGQKARNFRHEILVNAAKKAFAEAAEKSKLDADDRLKK
jgi:hypothetical protein